MSNDKKGKTLNLDTSKLNEKKRLSSSDKLGPFTERLKTIIGDKSARSFAISSGLSPAAFHKYLKGQSEPTRPVLYSIARAANVNMEWLVSGSGPKKKDETSLIQAQSTFKITNLEGRQVDFTPPPDLCHMPILSMEAACGNGAIISSEMIEAVFSATTTWCRKELGINPAHLCLIRARGDSMAGTILSEQMVFVDHTRSVEPCDGIWAYSNESALYLKRLQFLPGNKIEVNSDNPRYKSYIITPDDSFRLLGQAVATMPIQKL